MTSVAHEARASMAAHQNIGRVTKTDALCTKNVTTSTRGHGTCTDNEIGYRMLINDTIIDMFVISSLEFTLRSAFLWILKLSLLLRVLQKDSVCINNYV